MLSWKVTACRETCLVILFVAAASVSALRCQRNEICRCRSKQDGGLELDCYTKNDSIFNIVITPNRDIYSLTINCIDSPQWSDFRVDVPSLNYQIMSINSCDLPRNGSLGGIARMLGATGVQKLSFESGRNLSYVLEKRHLDGFENLKRLYLPNNNLSYVDKDLLADLGNLTFLDLMSNNLHLAAEFFDHTPALQYLELGDNDMRTIEPGTFDKLKNLTFLNLWQASLTELKPEVFNNLVALTSLDLHRNYFASLPVNVFAKLVNLQTLSLFRNNFTHLPQHLLRNNAQLVTVKLFDNRRMTTLPDEFFSNLTKLKVLMLERNGFVELPKDLFWGSNSLTTISLNQNYLKTLLKDIFRDSRNLRELDLSSNYLEELPDYIFSNTNQLVKLDLSKNRITSISRHMFNGLHELQELNMQANHLSTISDQSFSFLENLKIARFDNNRLTLQPTNFNYYDEFGTKSPFHYCQALEELYLTRNNISEIFGDWIVSLVQLHILDLKYNNISSITTTDLQFLSNHLKVNLSNNKIERILLHDAEEIARNQKHSRDVIILVEDNPLRCDCELYDFLRYIQGDMHPSVQNYFHIIPGNLFCHNSEGSESSKKVRVEDLKFMNLTCEVKNTDAFTVCPETCDCFLRPHDKTFIFDCSHKKFTSMPSDLRMPDNSSIYTFTKSVGSISQFELNFSDNRLTQMPNLTELGLESVEKLILSHNNISDISIAGLSNTIKVLELHDNNVARMSSDVLAFLRNSTNLTQMTLHENPWECDCYAKDFLNFIQTKFQMISELSEVICRDNHNPISEMTVTDFCPFDTTAIIGMSVAIALMGLIIGTIGLLYYKYQRQIKVWLFAHQWCLWFVTEEELDKDKLYDAFVSYSHKDHDFVVDELVPKLENGSTPFKLCLHYRDWLAGEWIPANIARSVEDSRRTIVVLSPNFLESIWGRMEFRAAHSQALSEGRARVILILFGDIGPTDNLDPELKAYISMNTYVKWGDPWFWDKLRYALPHQSKPPRSSNTGRKIFENHQLYIQANGSKKEHMYPVATPETPANTTPPADSLKVFLCDQKSEEESSSSDFVHESCKLNGDIAMILTPEKLMKNSSVIINKELTV